LRILFTVEFFWPHVGGAEMVVERVAGGLAGLGHEVHVATSADPNRAWFSLAGVAIREFDVRGNEVKGLRGDVRGYRDFVRSFECDVLVNYAAQSWSTDIAMRELGHLAARHTVLAPCGYSGLSTRPRRLAYRRYFARLPARLRQYSLLIYHSESFRDADFGRLHGIDRFVVIPNGVDYQALSRGPSAFRQDHGLGSQPLVVNISNHYRLKRHDRYFSLAERLAGQAQFVLLGQDAASARQSCSSSCAARAQGRAVRLLDGARSQVVAAVRDAAVLVLTSESEVAPLVLLEAAAAGVPWVAFDTGIVHELEGGIVVSDEAELETAVAWLLEDDRERERLGGVGQKFASGRSWTAITKLYEDALQVLVGGRAAASHAG
jgi:glycosyltransferase involved in cell wall biosynthesis